LGCFGSVLPNLIGHTLGETFLERVLNAFLGRPRSDGRERRNAVGIEDGEVHTLVSPETSAMKAQKG